MNVYEFQDYKRVIRAKLLENRLDKSYRTKLCERMGCQRSYFSQVINGHVHLTPDHAAALAEYWGLSHEESGYFLDLVLLARSGNAPFRSFLKKRMKKAKDTSSDPTHRFQWPKFNQSEYETTYYSSWIWSAVHIIVSIPKFRTATKIAERLGLAVHVVDRALSFLEGAKLIEKSSQGWKVTEKLMHLPNTSPMNEPHQISLRQKAIHNIQLQDPSELHYSAIFALSVDDVQRLKEMIVTHVEEMHRVIAPSPSEEIVCFSCDLFRI